MVYAEFMVKNRHLFIIGHILLDLGLLGYMSGNTALAYIGLIGSLIFFLRELVEVHLANKKKTEQTTITN